MSSTSTPPSPFDWGALRRTCEEEPDLRCREKMEKFLDALERMEVLGRVCACREAGLSRPTFNRWYKEFLAGGASVETLRALGTGRPHGLKTASPVVARVIELGGQRRQRGTSLFPPSPREVTETIRKEFEKSPHQVPSESTVRNILRANGSLLVQRQRGGRRRLVDESLLWRSDQANTRPDKTPFRPSGEQLGSHLVQSLFCVRLYAPISAPSSFFGETLLDEPVFGISLCVQAVIDPKSRYVWAVLDAGKLEGTPLALLQDVCAFYAARDRKPTLVKTAWRAEFCPMRGGWNREQDRHLAYKQYLEEQRIGHLSPTTYYDKCFGGCGSSHKFDPNFQAFIDTVRHGLLIPWSQHQASLASKGEPLDDFETLRAHFNGWVERYNDSLRPEGQ